MSGNSKGPEPVYLEPLEVTLESVRGDSDRMIRKFIRKVKADGVLREVYLRRGYKKPSVAKRDKRARAKSRFSSDERRSRN